MKRLSQLTREEKENGKREFLTPLPETLAEVEMLPVAKDAFFSTLTKAIVPSLESQPKER